jgi:hypothetical protein
MTKVADDADRVVVDAQRIGFPPQAKAVPWAPWRVVVVWMRGCGQHADVVRDGLAALELPTVVVIDDVGNLGVAAALAGHLDGEAELDLEEQLERILAGLGLVFDEAMGSSVETAVQADRPSVNALHDELLASAEQPLANAFPRAELREIIETELRALSSASCTANCC